MSVIFSSEISMVIAIVSNVMPRNSSHVVGGTILSLDVSTPRLSSRCVSAQYAAHILALTSAPTKSST